MFCMHMFCIPRAKHMHGVSLALVTYIMIRGYNNEVFIYVIAYKNWISNVFHSFLNKYFKFNLK